MGGTKHHIEGLELSRGSLLGVESRGSGGDGNCADFG
jgi:hypothetical protein